MKWTLSTLLMAVATCAAVFAVYRMAWESARTNHFVLLGAYLLVTCVAIVAAASPQSRWRSGFIGAALFGVAYLACVLKGGFGLETIYDAQALAKYTRLGLALLGVAFLATQLCTMLVRPDFKPRPADESTPEV